MKCRIGIITHGTSLEQRFSYLSEREECQLIFRLGGLEPSVEAAQTLEREEKVDAILCSPVTYQRIREQVRIPVIPLHLESFALINGIHHAMAYGKKIALMQFFNKSAVYNLDLICSIMGCEVTSFQLKDTTQVEPVILKIVEDGFDVLITTVEHFKGLAEKRGMQVFLLELQELEIIKAINLAKAVVKEADKNLAFSKFREAILDASSEGILSVDEKGLLEFINLPAQRLLNISNEADRKQDLFVLGKNNPLLRQILSCRESLETINNKGTPLLVSKQEIRNNRNVLIGSVIRITQIKELQSFEMKARKLMHKEGFIAKYSFSDIKGISAKLAECVNTAQKYALSSSNILIWGESGTGKEMFAQGIHNHSRHKNGPFLAINCATFPENLLESELFGYEEGAFTGAVRGGKAGLFEMAHNGTVFLDEIGEMPILLQSRLLRVLEERTVRRIGGSKNIIVNIRIISATNRDLFMEVKKGRFREDLYYRIDVLSLKIPPLRQRKEDIPVLIREFIKKMTQKDGVNVSLPQSYIQAMMQYDWYGNVRELQNFVEKIMILSDGKRISYETLKEMLCSALREDDDSCLTSVSKAKEQNSGTLTVPKGTLKEMEDYIISELYVRNGKNKEKLHQELGISLATIWRRLKEIEKPSR